MEKLPGVLYINCSYLLSCTQSKTIDHVMTDVRQVLGTYNIFGGLRRRAQGCPPLVEWGPKFNAHSSETVHTWRLASISGKIGMLEVSG